MDARSVENGLFEVPVVVICRHSPLLQPKLSWSSTIRVAVQHVKEDVPKERVEKNTTNSVIQASEACLCAGILPPEPLSKDEDCAKSLIDRNKGIVEVGAAWPTCYRKALWLHIVWNDVGRLLEVDCRSKNQHPNAVTMKFVLLIGARFVEAFVIYQHCRQLLMSSSILPFYEQQVAHEIKLLVVDLMKSLQNHPQFNVNQKDDVEERMLVTVMNFLVEMQLSDDKKVPLLSGSGNLVLSGDYSRILKHKVLCELVALLQNVLALRVPFKDSIDFSRLDEREKGARERVFCMRRAVLDIIELLRHTSQAGDLCTEIYLEDESSSTSFNSIVKHRGSEKLNKCIQEQIFQIEWKWLLAVLGKKDPVCLESILCGIQDEDKRRLLKVMAGPLDLVHHEGNEELEEKCMKSGASTSTDFVVKANPGGYGPGVVEVNGGGSCGYKIKSNEEVFGQSLFQGNEAEQYCLSEDRNQGNEHALTGAVRTDPACCQTARANEGEGQSATEYIEQHIEESRMQGQEHFECQEHSSANEGGGQSTAEYFEQHINRHMQGQEAGEHTLQEHTKDSGCIQERGARGHAPYQIQVCKTGGDFNKNVAPPHTSVLYDDDDSGAESPSWRTHQLQAHMCTDSSGGLQITNQTTASETLADSHVPDYTCSSYATSCSQPIASSDNDGDDDFRDDVAASKARRRKRRNRKTHRVKENQDLPTYSPRSHLRKSRFAARKIWLLVTMAFIFGFTVIGILWFQSDFSSNPKTRENRTFARGYLP